MGASDQLKATVVEYISAMRLLLLKPSEFFAGMPPLANYKQKLLFVLPVALVFALGMAWQAGSPWWVLAYLLEAYAGLGLWTVALKYVLVVFGEQRTFEDALHISSCAAVPLMIGWIPLVGLPAMYVLASLFTFLGLVFYFKMDKGAATAAVTLPVVVVGFGGAVLSMLFLWLASLSTMFIR